MTVDGTLSLLALVLAAVFVAAAVAKFRDRAGTTDTMASFRLPLPGVMAVVVPIIELAIAAVLVISPSAGALAGVTLLVFFTTFLLLQLRLGVTTPCRCFGSTSQHPLSYADVTRNLGLILIGMPVVTLLERATPTVVDVVVVVIVAGLAWQIQQRIRTGLQPSSSTRVG